MEAREPHALEPREGASPELPAAPAARPGPARAVSDWLHQLARTVKTCRLYDARNPTVFSMRQELAEALAALLGEHGEFEVAFSPDVISLAGTPLYTARSREDNLALPFYRDGIRALSVRRGTEAREVDALVDALLTVMRTGNDDADLVTLLWEADLEHLAIEHVSFDGDVESGGDGPLDAEAAPGTIAPFPRHAPAGVAPPGGPTAATRMDDTGRSDDRVTSGRPADAETALGELERDAEPEVERLLREFQEQSAIPLARRALQLVAACFARAREADRHELRQFLPRLLHEAVGRGDWREAHECLYLMRAPNGERDAVAAFAADIARPESLTSRHAWACLDRQTPDQQESFFDFARELGPEGTDWLMRGIAESPRKGLRRRLAYALAEIVSGYSERLAPWLADPRWYVVRNVVYVLGLMDEAAPLGLLRSVAGHPEPRVRREVVTALGRVPRAAARPILLEMLAKADTRLLVAILHQLSREPDLPLAAMLFEQIEDETFAGRPEEERRAMYQALVTTGGDAVVPLLESHVLQGRWLQRGDEASRMAAVLCLARIGTPAARAILEEGVRSRRGEVARACRTGLASMRPPDPGPAR